jgi:hypothetical protein
MENVKTTLEIPDPLFRRVKSRAVMQGVKLKDFVPRLLEAGMERMDALPKKRGPARKASPFPLIRGRGGPLLASLDNALIARLLEDPGFEKQR